MEFIKTKTILTKVNYGNDWYGVNYNMNLYRGCSHNCIYCDSRSNCYHIDHFNIVKGKEKALLILENELKKKDKGIISMGSMSDPYNIEEIHYQETRKALQLISKYQFGLSLDTKSDLIIRDLDILKEINSKNNVIIKFTITTPYDKLSKIIEPGVCETSKRLQAMKILSDNNIFVGIMMSPVLPFITDNLDDIKELVRLAHLNGAKFIYSMMGVTLRDRQREYYYQKLDQYFPGLKEKYIKYFGEKYFCSPLNYQKLMNTFITECSKYGILYKMEDIIKEYKKDIKSNEQISFFGKKEEYE